jgi:hypothetical protein
LPPKTDHGWASGLAGTAKTSTAEAPMGATMASSGGPPSASQQHSAANYHTKESFVCGCATKEANNRPKDRDTFRQPPGPRLNDRTRYRPRYGRAVAAAEHFFVR